MRFAPPLVPGTLDRRYKRFLADVFLDSGQHVTAHVPNSGSMRSLLAPGARAWLSRADNPHRKLPWTLELLEAGPSGRVPVVVNTMRPNEVAREALEARRIPALAAWGSVRAEVPYGEEGSRIDLLLEEPGLPPAWVEVKNATLLEEPGVVRFPDAVTERGARHLRELARMVAQGHRGVLLFLASRPDAEVVRPADDVDPAYGKALREAVSRGVDVMAWRLRVSPEGLEVDRPLPVDLGVAGAEVRR